MKEVDADVNALELSYIKNKTLQALDHSLAKSKIDPVVIGALTGLLATVAGIEAQEKYYPKGQ